MDETPRSKDEPPGRGWLPARVGRDGAELVVDWAHFGSQRLTESFFEESVAAVWRSATCPHTTTRLADLTSQTGSSASLEPTGLIFHMSRCGSTLASQMLAACSANIVVSEASPIDAVVRLDASEDERVALLRAMVLALGQVRNPGEIRYFLKLDCWHACALPL